MNGNYADKLGCSLRPARYKNFGPTTSSLLDIVRNHEKMRIPKFQNHRLTATFARVNLQFRIFLEKYPFFGKTSICTGICPFFGKLSICPAICPWIGRLVGQSVILSIHSSVNHFVSWSVSASASPSV